MTAAQLRILVYFLIKTKTQNSAVAPVGNLYLQGVRQTALC